MLFFISIGFVSFFCGLLLVGFLNYMAKRRLIKEAEAESREILLAVQQTVDDNLSDLQRQLDEEGLLAIEKFKKGAEALITQNEELESQLQEEEVQFEEQLGEKRLICKVQQSEIDRYQALINKKQRHLGEVKEKFQNLGVRYKEELQKRFSFDAQEIKVSLKQRMEEDTLSILKRNLQLQEDLAQQNAERSAKAVIHIVLNRFARAYCPERGFKYVDLTDDLTKKLLFEGGHIRQIEEICGVDLIYREDINSISVSGFDPVRREWALSSVKKMLAVSKDLNEESVARLCHKGKRNLLQTIKKNGKKLFKELKLEGGHPEVVHMMGALRYRYSFSQNQYFHCSEVGFLCGLLASELELPISEARRIGTFHDIGKAMDHSLEGGHAVIGADFIQKYGESASVVHAVRAHHYDEEPQTDLAFLVIAADAISGTRPGARRSTTDSYMQKMDQLQEIGNSFDDIKDIFIMNAGRDIRIKVDSPKVSDRDILELSQKVARKIEDECNYPGQIKVTIVRQTQAVEYAK